jgi:hypothetical protein
VNQVKSIPYLACTKMRRMRRALQSLFGGAVGKDLAQGEERLGRLERSLLVSQQEVSLDSTVKLITKAVATLNPIRRLAERGALLFLVHRSSLLARVEPADGRSLRCYWHDQNKRGSASVR